MYIYSYTHTHTHTHTLTYILNIFIYILFKNLEICQGISLKYFAIVHLYILLVIWHSFFCYLR